MAHRINKQAFYSFAITAVFVFSLLPGHSSAQALGPGDLFPDFSHANNLDTPECDYLGIDPAASIRLGSLKQDIVILEFMNVFCDMCRENVELYNELYEASLSHPELAGTFAVLGIAVGNSFEEVMQFSDELYVRYPILLDSEREILSLTGSVRGAPQTYLLQRQGDRYVIRHFSRSAADSDEYLSMIRTYVRSSMDKNTTPAQTFPYCFMVDGVKHAEKQFTGSRVLLYFPHERTYPHNSDTRNMAQQVRVFKRILEQYPDIKIIVLEPEGEEGKSLKGVELPPGITRATGDEALFAQLASKDHPTVYYIEAAGNALFKGQALTLSAMRSMIELGRYRAEPDMPEADIISLITRTLAEQDATVRDTVKTDIDGHEVYLTRTNNPDRFYYSRLESSPSLCDLCHDSHFIYSIDPRGTIVAFIPIALTKRGNAGWDVSEVAAYRKAFTGKNIRTTFQFNAAVDAISGATITSSIVYEGFNHGKTIFKPGQPLPANTTQSSVANRPSVSN